MDKIVAIFVVVFSSSFAAEFKNCDPKLPVQMYFTFGDPLTVTLGKPLNIIGGALVKETFPEQFQVKHIMKRRLFGKWYQLPCFGKVGSCIDPMPCEMFLEFGFNGTCPIQVGNYKDYKLHIPVPKFPVPAWLTDGLYHMHIEGYDNSMKKMWFCGDLTQYIEQARQEDSTEKDKDSLRRIIT